MAGFLIFLGLVGIVVAVIMLAARAVFKKGWPYKKAGILAGIAVIVLIIGSALAGPSVQKGYEAGKQAAQNPPAQTQDTQPVKNSAPAQTNSNAPQQQDQKTESNGQNLIPGIAAADIKLNLEKWGLKFTGPRPLKEFEGYLDDGKATDSDTGVELSCTISALDPTKVKSVTFRAEGSLVAGALPPEAYLAVAKGFLGFAATLPYDNSEPAKARAWVEENIDKANQSGKPITTTIGSVEFTLAGGKYIRLLSLKPVRSSE